MTDTLFTGVDHAVFVTMFAARLRAAGVDASLASTERCAAAMTAVRPRRLGDLYWLTRVSLVRESSQLPRFDAVFDAVFQTDSSLLRTKARPTEPQAMPAPREDDELVPVRTDRDVATSSSAGLPWATLPSILEGDEGDEGDDEDDDRGDDTAIPELRPSAVDAEMDRPFAQLDDAELTRIGRLLEERLHDWPHRRSRRRRERRSGRSVALRRSLRAAMRTGGDVSRFWYQQPTERPRPVVVLVDVSRSMERDARAYLHLTRPLALTHHAEVFAFSTQLTRLTPSLRARSPAAAIDHASGAVGDRFSGTRLASSVEELVHHRVWNTTLRGAVVLVCSDGWDADSPDRLGRAMCRLHRLAHRVVWVNPRAAAHGFEPRTGGMAAALPFCDEFLPGHTGRAMDQVLDALLSDRRSRGRPIS